MLIDKNTKCQVEVLQYLCGGVKVSVYSEENAERINRNGENCPSEYVMDVSDLEEVPEIYYIQTFGRLTRLEGNSKVGRNLDNSPIRITPIINGRVDPANPPSPSPISLIKLSQYASLTSLLAEIAKTLTDSELVEVVNMAVNNVQYHKNDSNN